MADLEVLRRRIDAVDAQLLELFQQRMHLAAEAAAWKRTAGLPLSHPEREQQILARIEAQVEPELAATARQLFSTLIALSKQYQNSLNVAALQENKRNIALIGMPGAGKSSIGRSLSDLGGWPCYDIDDMVEEKSGQTIAELFTTAGEAHFRDLEAQALAEALSGQQRVIACGGGTVLRPANRRLLQENSRIYWVQRSLDQLARLGRPLSEQQSLETLYAERRPIYAALADAIVANESTIAEAACQIAILHAGETP